MVARRGMMAAPPIHANEGNAVRLEPLCTLSMRYTEGSFIRPYGVAWR